MLKKLSIIEFANISDRSKILELLSTCHNFRFVLKKPESNGPIT